MTDVVRSGLLVQTCLEVLRDADRPLAAQDAIEAVRQRIGDFSEYERELLADRRVRWINMLRWRAADMATVGWMSKTDGWRITDSGLQALETYPDGEELLRALMRLRHRVYEERRRAVAALAPYEQDISLALGEVAAGQWTSYQDIAELTGTDAETVANFLAKQRVPNAHRVLRDDGTPPPEGMLNQWLRGADMRDRLTEEGVDFDPQGRADQTLRVSADDLRAHQTEVATADGAAEGRPPSAWLIRGSVDGYHLVPTWLTDGYVSLAASRLAPTVVTADRPAIEAAVKEAYDFKSYAQLDRLVREVDAFLRQLRPDDFVVTIDNGRLLIGRITGEPFFADPPDGRANLRRPVEWLNRPAPVDYSELSPAFVNQLADQSHVVNLTDVVDQVQSLVSRPEEQVDTPTAALAPVTAALVETLHLPDQEWLTDVAELLAEKKQIILYGPPGTGKTYFATHLARHLAGGEQAVKVVQFHPSYTYEDFFEGYRPRTAAGGQLSFELRPGPLRDLADTAHEHPQTAYILVIDEINRGNLAKIFGELYFLLEYRDQRISLQYSPDTRFSLPENLYLIGTMNTADRSIALVDAAMRRRFGFVELHPQQEPVRGVLRRWLARRGYGDEPAWLLDALNDRLTDREYAIGPSYLMREAIYQRQDGLARVWRTELLPLLEELHYGENVDVAARYGLPALRARLAADENP